MLRIIYAILFILNYNCCFSQIETDKFYSGKAITLRTNPFSFIKQDAGIMLGANYRWHERWSATVDPTFIFYAIETSGSSIDPGKPLGIRVVTDLRYHIRNFFGGFENIFISPEVTLGYVRSKKEAEFGINCVGQNCAYYTLQEYTEIKKEAGAAIKIGLIGPIRKKNDNWKLELFSGVGVSFFDFQEKGIPEGGSFVILPTHENILGTLEEDEPNLAIPFGLKITYRIR